MRAALFCLLLGSWAWARPAAFSDSGCRIVFPAPYRAESERIRSDFAGCRYWLLRTPLKTLDPAQHLARTRRLEQTRHSKIQLIRVDGLNGLEVRRPHSLARIFVFQQTAYQAQVDFPGAEPGGVHPFVASLRFSQSSRTAYVPQRMARYDAQFANVPLDKCAENLLAISSLLTGYKLKHKKFPSALSTLAQPVTRAYGYRLKNGHYLLFCSKHHHRGVPAGYPRSDDALHTLLAPNRPYRPGY